MAADSLVSLLRSRAEERRDVVSYRFLRDGDLEDRSIAYGALDGAAREIAGRLEREGACGERVLLVFPPGLGFIEAFFGCLYAGAIAVPAYPPEPTRLARTLPRLAAIARDCRPALGLQPGAGIEASRAAFGSVPELASIRWLASDERSPSEAPRWSGRQPDGETVAFLQYTSGSTAAPRGVIVTHANLLYTMSDMNVGWGPVADPVMVSWLPTSHDLGLIYGLLFPLLLGFPSVILPPESFLRRPGRWLRAISRYRGTHSAAPNFAYDLCVRKVPAEERAGLDLRSWRLAMNAAEPVRWETIERFVETFGPAGFDRGTFNPCYGLAEATLKGSTPRVGEGPSRVRIDAEALAEGRVRRIVGPDDAPGARSVVRCGRTALASEAIIVDPESRRRAAPDAVGEIWLRGPGNARGYWGRPDESEAVFRAGIADTGEGPFLRTGDLGFLDDGQLVITGRRKDIIIIRGRNHYPQDIERAVEAAHPRVRPGCSAAFAVDDGAEERLQVALEVDSIADGAHGATVVERVREAIFASFELETHAVALLEPGTIPKTASGKIMRSACRAGLQDGSLRPAVSWAAPSAEAAARAAGAAPAAPAAGGGTGRPPEPEAGGGAARADRAIGWLREFAATRIHPGLIDERRAIPPHVVLELGNRGLLGLEVDAATGGLGLSRRDALRVYAQLGAIDLCVALFVGNHNVLGIGPIRDHAAPELRARLLRHLAGGRGLAAFALTEPGAGSDPRAAAAAAVPDGRGGFILHGKKLWSGSAAWATVLNVFAVERNPAGRALGLRGFVVPADAPGLRHGPEAPTLGMRGMVQNTVLLEGVPAAAGERLGPEGDGAEAAYGAMRAGRLAIAAMCGGAMKRCAQLALRYASRRTIATGRLVESAAARARLHGLVGAIGALEALVARVGALVDRGERVPDEAYCALKMAGPELLWGAADGLVQLLGGRGYIETNPAAQMLRDARAFRIIEGPTEAMAHHLGALALRDAAPLGRLLAAELGAPEVASELEGALAAVCARFAGGSAGEDAGALSGAACAHAGEVAEAACLLAAAASGGGRAAEWGRARFERAIARARDADRRAFLVRPADLARAIEDYASAVGEARPSTAAGLETIDPLLLPEGPGTARADDAGVPRAPAAASSSQAGAAVAGARELEEWVVAWLARELRVAPGAVDPAATLAQTGLDSLGAAELAEALAEHLGRPVPATVAWSAPTPRALARLLASESGAAASIDSPRSEAALAEAISKVEALSDDEVRRLLGSPRGET
jgi:acyl-CoA synthetase (AMP-forming)/AMP-acid ligase II/alkylation response protein AidB-like acyl-CoA dehydrogenase/acyl carrier protein